ncbi:MAG: N-acetyl-D-Glu racemase DgcA [Pseudomonadota bacterium]
MGLTLQVTHERFALRAPFAISRGTKTHADVVSVMLEADGKRGFGEAVPYARYRETVEATLAAIETAAAALDGTSHPRDLLDLLPAGAARNALDAALWDLTAKRAGRPIADLLGLPPPLPLTTAYTLSLSDPAAMGRAAAHAQGRFSVLKIKLGGEDDIARLEAVREGAPAAKLIIDANEAWSADTFAALQPDLARLNVSLVEQPLPADADEALAHLKRRVPVCADESAHTLADLPSLAGKYDAINIKLDKTGGLTHALELKRAAQAAGLTIMVGCMVATSRAMAPAHLLAQGASFVDLDGPLLLAHDRPTPLRYEDAMVAPPATALWG